MLLMLNLACAICGGKVPAPAGPPVTLPAVASKPATLPPCSGLEPRLWPQTTLAEPVLVVVDGSFVPPDWFTMSAEVDSLAQGTVAGTRLCELAALPGVIGVRPPMLAHPMPGR